MSDLRFGLAIPEDLFSPTAEAVVTEYARRLADWAQLNEFPRSMRALAEKLEHRVVQASLPPGLRGMRLPLSQPLIVTSEIETYAAQERTIAHELFHPFIGIAHHEDRISPVKLTPLQRRVEALCEIGAAELHVPSAELKRLMPEGPKIVDIPWFAKYFGASLSATLRHAVAAASIPVAGIVFEYGNKPRDTVISPTGQQVLFGVPEDYDSPKRLRIHDWSVTDSSSVRFNSHKHIEEDTSIFAAYSSQTTTEGWDDLTSIGLADGTYRTESWPHKYQDTGRVLTLIWLDSVAMPTVRVSASMVRVTD